MAVRMADGRYAMSSTRKTFQGDIWQRRAGTAGPVAWPGAGLNGTDRLRCDPLGCLHRTDGWTVVLARHRAALLEDCHAGAIVVSLVPVWRRHCRGPSRLIRPYDLWRNGPHAIWLEPDGARIRHVRSASGVRPWTAAGRREARRGRD